MPNKKHATRLKTSGTVGFCGSELKVSSLVKIPDDVTTPFHQLMITQLLMCCLTKFMVWFQNRFIKQIESIESFLSFLIIHNCNVSICIYYSSNTLHMGEPG